ncbi:hypothetical protein C8N40_102329 [Pontibacter mucosus]|uniref:Uncharacterized protein n=1 Tax=Pontibacter mucosus TaxID=1649266 RepID=A0A2T5YPW9_9BACT|nr:hypothetical protein C8N40_102329 [Pontibacter mucosus]
MTKESALKLFGISKIPFWVEVKVSIQSINAAAIQCNHIMAPGQERPLR